MPRGSAIVAPDRVIYVAGAQYGPSFEGLPELYGHPSPAPWGWEDGDTGWVTAFSAGTLGPRTSWMMPHFGGYSEVERIAADDDGVYVQYISGPGFSGDFKLSKYSSDGVLLWGPISRVNEDSFDIKCYDGRVFTHFGGFHPIMVDAGSGEIIYEYELPYTGTVLSGAAKGPGDTMYVAERTAGGGGGGRYHRLGPGGIEASSVTGPVGDDGSVDYYGGTHPDRNRFYVWSSRFISGVGSFTVFDEWQGYPTVQYIRTIFDWGPDAEVTGPGGIAVDESTGNIYAREFNGPNQHKVRGYTADGVFLWEATSPVEDDATQFLAQDGLVYCAGFTDRPDLVQGMLPALLVLDGATGAVVEPLVEWGQDALASTDIYGLAVGGGLGPIATGRMG